jgi:hypothetical protein
MELAVLLPIAAFIALAAGLAVVLHGAGSSADARALHFRGSVKDLAASRVPMYGQIDAVRRRQVDPDHHRRAITAAATGSTLCGRSAQSRGRAKADQPITRREPERPSGRSDGRHGTTDPCYGRRGARARAQTAIKRGYLNLIHAREAFARHAAEAHDLEADENPQKADRWSA